jgi:RimJ/RimL family protein N-acetyltransferase
MNMLKGEKVYLNLVEFEDIPNRVKWINNDEVQNTLMYDVPTSLAKTTEWYKKSIMDPTRREFSIFTIDNSVNIGFCGLININTKTKSAELHCVIGDTSYWKGGYGSETYRLLMDYGFEELGLNKIYGYQLLHNYGAHRVVEKLGWKREGLLRQEMYGHGKLHDVYYVACLREDWENLKIEK